MRGRLERSRKWIITRASHKNLNSGLNFSRNLPMNILSAIPYPMAVATGRAEMTPTGAAEWPKEGREIETNG